MSFEDNLADGDPSDDDLSGDNPSDTGEQEMEQQVVLHLQAPETVPMGTAGSFGLSAQNTAATAAAVSIQLTQEEMEAYQAAEQDSTLALQLAGDSLTFTLQPGEQVEGTLSFLYPNGYSSREVVEIAEEDISIVLQQLPEEETGGTPIETIPPEGEIQTPPTDEAQQPGGEGSTDPSDEGEPTPPESGDGENPIDPSDEEEPTPPESGDGEEPTDPSDGGETTPPESGDGEEATDPSDGENETLPPESGDGEEATDSSNEEETTPPDDETDPSVGEGGVMPSDEQEQVLQTVEQSTVSLTQDYQTGPDGELSEEPTTDFKPADESGTTENEGSTEPSGSESGNPTDLENTGSTDSDNAGTGDNSSGGTEDDDRQGNDPTGSQGDGQQDGGPTGSDDTGSSAPTTPEGNDLTGSQGDDQQGNDPTGSQGDGQQDGDLTGSQGDGQQDGDLTGSQDNVQQGNDLTGSQDESGQEQPQVSFDIVGATLTFTASFGWGELTLSAQPQVQPLETEQQEAAAQGAVPQPDLSYTIEAASQNRETTGTIYTRSWSLQQVIALPQGASFVEGEAAVDGNQIRIGATPVLSVDDQSGTAGELSAQRDGETLLVTYTKTLSDWQSLEAESISDLGLAMTLHQEAIVRDESFTEGQVDVGATFTATPVTAAADAAAAAPVAVAATLDTGTDEQQDGSQSVTQQGSLSLPLSGEPQAEQPQSGDADEVTVTYEGTPIYTDDGQLAVQYTITVTNNNTADPEPPEGGESGEEEQPEGSDGAVTVKIVQNLSDECFSNSKPLGQETGDSDGDWDATNKTLTWENVEIAAGKNWTKTVTVLIDKDQLTSLENLPENLSSTVFVYNATAEGEEPPEELLKEITDEINLKEFVQSEENIVSGTLEPIPQTVIWLDNNASGNRPEPEVYAGKVGLQFYIGNQENPDEGEWITLDENNMAQLGLTEMPDILCPEDNTQSQWTLSAELPTEIGYKGTSITQQVKWRMTPPAEDAEIPAGPEEGGIRPNLSEVYYLDKVEGEVSETWYYLYRDEVSFNIDLRDAVNAGKIIEDQLKGLLTENFKLSYDAGDGEQSLNWDDITVDIKENGDGQYTLTLVNAVAYSRNGKGVHYYLKPMGSEDQEKKIPLNQNWPGNGEGGDYYDVECDNTGLDNVGNITDKVANGGTLVLTRQGEIEYQATKIWIDPDGNTDGRPEGHFELWRYTYSEDGGSFKEATTVTGVENVPFEDGTEDKDNQQTIIFENPNPTNPQNENLFPKYDKDGNRYVYIMKEVIESTEGALSYEQIFGEVNPTTGAVQDTKPPVEDKSWVRDSQDNFVYNNGTITNRINEKETVSVTKKWDAASFQASLEDVEVKVGLYGKPVGSNQNWEPVKGPDGENLVYTMSEFSAANDTMSQTVTVNSYNSEGQEMEYRFFEISVNGVPILKEEDLAAGAHLQDKEFTIKLDNGQELSFVSKRVDDEEIEETGEQVIENVIQDEITYTINKEWIAPTEPHPVRFAIYQQGPNAENKLVGIVTLDETKDEKGEYGKWTTPAGESTDPPTLIVGEEENQVPYEVTYQVTDGFAQLVIEGLPRYDEHGYTYEYIALELDGSPEQTTQIDADGNYITDVINGPGRGLRIMLRKRWIDNSDIEHREPVTLQVYYQVDEISDLENDFLLATVRLGEEGEPWYELVGFSEADLKEKLGEDFSTGNDFYKHLYIREISIGNSGADDRTTQEEIFIGEDGAVENKCVDQIEATNHTYEATYETQLDGLTVEEGEDTPGISDPLFIVTNRRLGNVDLTVTKEWQDGGQLQESLKGSNVVPVVKLVFDDEKNNAEPPAGVTSINYDTGTVQIGNEAVEIKGKEEDSREEAIQPLLEDEGLIEELYFYNLPKYDNQGRVARYKVVELWTTADNIDANGKVKKVGECYPLEEFKLPADTSEKLRSLLNDLQVSYQETSYKEMDEQKANDEQQITITNKLTGTKEIKFYKEWNDQYALEHGKRPDLYLTLYRTTKGSGKMQLYADHSWDKQALTISEDGGENAAQEEKETDENYWICTFPDLPKYDEKGDEYIYYAVERLTVNDPSDFDYAPAQFKYDGVQESNLTVEYDENGKVVELPSVEVDDHRVLIETDESGDVALLEGGTFVNSLEEAVTITGRKLWNSVPLTADSADLPTVTFEIYQYLEGSEPSDLHENLNEGTKVASMTIKSEEWENLKTDDNQYEFKFDGMNEGDNEDPFPLYNEDGQRYVYVLHEKTEDALESGTEWNLVYEDPVYNEYQITNTYAPQLGALSVKKLLQVDARWPSGQYPAITMFLERGVMENGNWVKDDTYQGETIVWTSTQVEEAAKKAVESNPSEQTVVLSSRGTDGESIFLFKNLEMYAPNGEAYYYRVVEQLDNMHYEAAVVSEDDSSTNGVGKDLGNVSDINDVFGDKGYQAEEGKAELATKPLRPIENEDWSNGSGGSVESDGNVNPEALTPRATFGDQYPEGETITLKVTKEWLDNNDALELRPESATFIESLSVWRKADGQGVTGGAEAIPEQRIKVEIIATDDQADNHYTYTITGKDGEDLEKIAPNGMPWIYVVKEESTGTTWEAYILTDEEGKEITEVSKSAKDAENGVLTLPEMHNHLTVTHTFTKNWENAGDDNLTWENIGVEEMKVTGTLYVGVMNENGTGLQEDSEMKLASEFLTESQWNEWFKNLGGLGEEEENYKFEKSQTIDVGTEGEIKFENLPLVQKNEDSSTSPLVYVVAETKVEFEVGGKNYSQKFEPKFEVKDGSLTITYTPGNLTVDGAKSAENFFKPSDVTFKLSDLFNKSSSSSSATNTIATTGLTITKNWVDNENEEGLRPESVDIVILQEKNDSQSGEESARAALFTSRQAPNQTTKSDSNIENVVLENDGSVKVVTLNEANNWSAEIENLPGLGFDDKGNLITYKYTVRELKEDWKEDAGASVPMQDDLVDEANSKFNSYYTTSYGPEAGTVTNTLTHMDITAVKAWKPEGLHGDYAEVTFELQSRVEGAGDWSMVNIEGQENPVILDGTPDGDGAGEFEAWKARWTELPRTDSNGSTIEYRVKETLASDLIENEHVTILYPEKGITGSTADKTYTVTNIPLGQLTVTKKNGDGNGLAGVEFTLTGGSDGARKVITDASGEAIFDKLPLYDKQGNAITYTLTESSTPDDYIQLDEEINVSFTATDRPEDGIYWETTDGKYLLHEVEYEVVNGQYFPVVHTGGSGFYWPGVLGAGAAAAGVLYLIRRKTKGHNTER